MKILTCNTPGTFRYSDADKPVLKKDHAIIRIRRVGVCGTDLHAYRGTQPYFTYPRILGHELAGELVEADGAAGFEPGELVTVMPYFYCGQCIACRTGKPNCCANIQVCGVHTDGAMVEYLQVPWYSLLHGEGLTVDELALVEPLAIGAHGIRRAQVQKDDFVLVLGAGPIGLGLLEFARIAGGVPIGLDISDDRLDFCKSQLGVSHTVNPNHGDPLEQIRSITNGDMASVVIDATGNLKAINSGITYLAHGGRYVLVGLQKEAFSFSHPEFHKRETSLMSSRNATTEDFQQVIASIKKGLVKPSNYITHRIAFQEAGERFESLLQPENRVIKAMIEFD